MSVRHYLLLLLSLALWVSPLRAQPQPDNYDLITTRQGLPHNTVLALLQDTDGFLWIGTYNGLCRYDGHSFKVHHLSGQLPGGDLPVINCLYEDREGNIWAGSTSRWLVRVAHGTHEVRVCHLAGPRIAGRMTGMCEDETGHLWIGYNDGSLADIAGDSLRVRYGAGVPLLALSAAGAGRLVLLTSDGFVSYNTATGTGKPVAAAGWQPSPGITGIVSKGRKTTFVIDTDCVVLNMAGQRVVRHVRLLPGRKQRYHAVGPAGSAGFIYTNGDVINKYDEAGTLRDSIAVSGSLGYDKNETVNCIIEDRGHIIWMGTNAGLVKVDRYRSRFTRYAQHSGPYKLSNNYIRCIEPLGDDVWLGFRASGIAHMRWNGATGAYAMVQTYALLWQGPPMNEYTTNVIRRLADGRLLAGGEHGLFALEPNGRLFKRFLPGLVPLSLSQVWAIYEDAAGRIWVGTNRDGLYIIDVAGGKIRQYWPSAGDGSEAATCVWNIFVDAKGVMWLGADNGLYRVAEREGAGEPQFELQTLKPGGTRNVWCLAEDGQGSLWVGAVGDGLFRMSADRRQVAAVSKFPVPFVSSVVPGRGSDVWVGTIDGLFRYDAATGDIVRFDEQDGLINNDFNFKAASATPSGIMLFGGKAGMVQFYPDSIYKRTPANANVRITNINVSRKGVVALPPHGQVLELKSTQNELDIDFTILDFSEPRSHMFRYRLTGFDHQWNYADASHARARYTNIPPGSYHFVAEGSADGAHWSSNTAVLDLYIKPALWQRPSFWVMCGVLLLLCAGGAVYYRIRMVVKRERLTHEIEKNMAALELRALQAQMNPHFLFNTINAIQHFILHRKEIEANDYLSRFARLMRLFLESSRNRYITVQKEMEILELYLSLEKLRFDDKFDYRISIADEAVRQVAIPSMLIQPFAENAVVHGLVHKEGKGMLHISFGMVAGGAPCLRCVIEDDGIGRERSAAINALRHKEHVSRGMELIMERIKTYNFIDEEHIEVRLIDKQLPEQGTIVEVLIPVHNHI